MKYDEAKLVDPARLIYQLPDGEFLDKPTLIARKQGWQEARTELVLTRITDEEIMAWSKSYGYYSWDLMGLKGISIGAEAQLAHDQETIREVAGEGEAAVSNVP